MKNPQVTSNRTMRRIHRRVFQSAVEGPYLNSRKHRRNSARQYTRSAMFNNAGRMEKELTFQTPTYDTHGHTHQRGGSNNYH